MRQILDEATGILEGLQKRKEFLSMLLLTEISELLFKKFSDHM